MLINISIHIQDRTNKTIIQDNKRKFFILPAGLRFIPYKYI